MFTILIRAFILYLLMILAIRGMGKRQMGQFQPYEFAMALLVANIMATPMADVSTPLLHGAVPVAALLAVHGLISILCMRSDRVRAFISGKPSLLMAKGVIDDKELNRLCLTLSDLLEGIRQSGILDPADVECAVMEANGTITAFPRASRRPPNTAECAIDPGYEGLPQALVMNGRVQTDNLSRANLSEKWLSSKLRAQGIALKDVYFASISTQGLLTVQRNDGVISQIQAIDAGKVAW